MRLLELELRDFRNHETARASLDGDSAVLVGENGSGKTNWVEAAVLLSIGRSFRGARDRDLVRRGCDRFEVRGEVANRAGIRSEITARGRESAAREVRVDGALLPRLAGLLGRFPTVHFSVEDVAALNGGPAGRRRFLDVSLCQLEPAYVGYLREYSTALRQRNRLLGEPAGVPADNQLGAWEEILARSGSELDRRRRELTGELARVLMELAERLDPALRPSLEYRAGEPEEQGGSDGTADRDADVTRRVERLAALRGRDRRLGWTTEGPHRAGVSCRVAGHDLAEGVSRGMVRLYSILLRLALARILDARLEEPPVVLLDDPESELDPRWLGLLLCLVPCGSQVVVTACRPLASLPDGFRRIPMHTLAGSGVQRSTPLERRP